MLERAAVMMKKTVGQESREYAMVLNSQALMLMDQVIVEQESGLDDAVQAKFDEAMALRKRCLEIELKVLGPDHPQVGASLRNMAGLLIHLGKYEEAANLALSANKIVESALGSDHPDLAFGLNTLASSLSPQGKRKEAIPLLRRAIAIGEGAMGPDHPDLAIWLNNLAGLLQDLVGC